MVKVKVPATTTNLGSCIDSLGIALNLYNYIEIEECDGYKTNSDDSKKSSDEDLVFYSAVKLFQECGRPVKGFKINIENNIPKNRGLGSKSSFIAGGLIGANKILGNPLTEPDLINLAYSIEGYSNSVVPAISGGFTSSAIDEKKIKYCRFDLPDNLIFALFIPPFEINNPVTDQNFSMNDAIYDISRSSLMTASLISGKYSNLQCASKDKMIQNNLMHLIPGAEKLLNRVLGYNAIMSYISGNGPSIVALYKGKIETIDYSVSTLIEDREYDGWEYKLLTCDNDGATVL